MGTICPQLWVLCAMSEEKWHILHSLTVTSTGHDSELASQAVHLEPPALKREVPKRLRLHMRLKRKAESPDLLCDRSPCLAPPKVFCFEF